MHFKMLPGKPELYHGKEKSRPYFEGWYYKYHSESLDFDLAVIPGICRGKDPGDDHSFIQVFYNGKNNFIKFASEEFKAAEDAFIIKIGNNEFSDSVMKLDVKTENLSISADLQLFSLTPLETGILSPSIMGPFSYLPGMQCNHGVISLHHSVKGKLRINGAGFSANDIKGYIEKDWGRAFPDSWLWLQANGFNNNGKTACCMCSIARIPYAGMKFTGLIAVVASRDKQYRFATYNFSRIKHFNRIKSGVEIVLRKFNYTLHIYAESDSFTDLLAPTGTGMDRKIKESLSANIRWTLKRGSEVISEFSGNHGGLEISEIDSIINE